VSDAPEAFPVDNDKALPPTRGGRIPTPLFEQIRNTLRGLLIGGSFFVPTTGSQLELRYVRNAAWHIIAKDNQMAGKRIKTRTLYENGKKGVRIWRTQ
jgi:hypothetical protein